MAEIDLDKFVTSLLCGDPQCNWTIGTVDIRNALKEQGLKYKDGQIVEIKQESEDERIRKELINVFSNREKYLIDQSFGDITVSEALAWLEKQGDCSAKWEKNTADNKPTLNHSVLMKNIHGIAEGEWNGKEWIQYRWSSNIKDSDVLHWMNLYELEKQGKED